MLKTTYALFAATAATALLGAPAMAWEDTSETPLSVFEADQTQTSDVHSEISIVVEEYSAERVSNSIALGNNATGHVKSGDIDSDIIQDLYGDVVADNYIWGGDSTHTVGTTTAYGNSASGGTWDGINYYRADQIAAGDVAANTTVAMDGAYQIATGTSAIANVSVSAAEYDTNKSFQTQHSEGSVEANTDVILCCDGNVAAFTTTAGANAVSSQSSSATNYTGAVQTTAAGETVRAESDIRVYQGHNVHTSSAAFGNSATVHNQWGYATLGRDGSELYQENNADIEANSYVTLDHWSGMSTATAYGLGNSALISNVGSDTDLYADQFNNGDVVAGVDFGGEAWTGGAGIATATAIGNAATATLCNLCGDAAINGRVTQVNNGTVSASTTINAPYATSLHGTATAVGNSATFNSTGQ